MPKVSEEHLDQSKFQLFTGKVLSIETSTMPLYSDTVGISEYQKEQTRTFKLITISVMESYGNEVQNDTIQIATGMGAPDCGVTFFKKNKKYLFTVGTKDESQKYFWTSICVPNRELKKAQNEIEFIEQN